MSTHVPLRRISRGVNRSRFCRNGRPPEAPFFRTVANDFNHVVAFRKKEVGLYCTNLQNIPTGSIGTTDRWFFYAHTGEGTDHLRFVVLQAKPDNANATDPFVQMSVDDGGGAVTSDPIRYTAIDASPSDVPDEFAYGEVDVEADPDTTYEIIVQAVDYARPIAVSVHEIGIIPVDTSKGGVDPGYSVGTPIDDAQIQQLLEAGTALWRHNAVPLWTWTRDVTSPTITGSTLTNVLDGSSTAVGSSTPGATIDLTRHDSLTADVPVIFAVRGEQVAGGGSALIELADSSGGIFQHSVTTRQWYASGSGVITLSGGSHKLDVRAAETSGGTVRIDAFALYTYET